MLGKLFKYDFKWINKVMYIYFAIFLIITVCVKIVEGMEQTLLMVIIDKILSGMFISCCISIIITCFIRIWVRFMTNFYKDESYLTHTLPVTKSELFNSKVISSILSLILSIVVVLIGIFYVYLGNNGFEVLKNMYQSLVNVYNSSFAVLFVVGLIVIVLLEVIYFMLSGMFGIVMGYRSNNHKTLKSIIIGIFTYGILSIISVSIFSLIGNYAEFNIVVDGFPDLNTVRSMGITGIVIYFVFDVLYYFVIKRIFNSGVNVD